MMTRNNVDQYDISVKWGSVNTNSHSQY